MNKLGNQSVAAFQKWRSFFRHFDGRVDDWNMGTLLRLDANKEVSDANTTIGMMLVYLISEVTCGMI